MRIETIEIFTFDELSPEAQAKAIEKLSDINVTFDWWDSVYQDAKDIGLKITGFDAANNSTGELLLSASEVAQNILNNHGKVCDTYKAAEYFLSVWQPVFNEYMEKQSTELKNRLMEIENDFLKSILKCYKISLSKEYDYLISEESIKETIIANEYEFTADGKLYNSQALKG